MPRIAASINLDRKGMAELEKRIEKMKLELGEDKCDTERNYLHMKIIHMAARGFKNKAIAEELKVSEQTVAKWRNKFSEEGFSALERPRQGIEHKVSDEELKRKITRILQDNPRKSSRKIAEELERKGGERYAFSHSTVNEIIKKYNLKERAKNYWEGLQRVEIGGKFIEVRALIQNPDYTGLILGNRYKEPTPDAFAKYGRERNLLVAQVVSGKLSEGTEKEAVIDFFGEIENVLNWNRGENLFLILYAKSENNELKEWLSEHKNQFKVQLANSFETWLLYVEVFVRLLIKEGVDKSIFESEEEVVSTIVKNIRDNQESGKSFSWIYND